MKKLISILVVGIFVLSGLGAVALTESIKENIISEEMSFSMPIVKEKDNFVTLELNQANSYIMEQGKPVLPIVVKEFIFPFGTIIKDVTCTPKNIEELTISKNILPTPEPISAEISNTKNKEIIDYGTDPYPDTWFTYDVGTGIQKEGRSVILKVSFYPIKYFPSDSIINWAKNVEIKIQYEDPIETQTFLDDYNFVVIGPSDFSDELSSLITHKNSRGITTIFVSLSDIYGGTYFTATGRDNQEKIKYFIKNAIENWNTENVMFVGGSNEVPTRDTHIYFADGDDDEIFLSDLYYADIYDDEMAFCSWDSNGNDVFGELNWGTSHNYDEVDLYPDVYFGRLACFNSNQVTTCVNKIKNYENSEAYAQNWFNDMIVIGGDHAPGDDNAIPEGEFVNEKIIDIMDGFIPDKVWDSNGKLSGLLPTGVQEITSALNLGGGFVDFSGHGNTNVWATHAHEDEKWLPTPNGYYLNTKVQGLSNGNELPIVIIGACSTCKFRDDNDCFGWSFLMNGNGGGIASCGASALDWFYYGEYIIEKGFEKICIDSFQAYSDGAMTFGEMWNGAINGYIYPGMDALDHKTVEEFQSFGDPTLAIRSDSQAPNKPATPTGPLNGQVGTTYTYTTSATDPENDDVYYLFDWGDGTFSNWVGPKSSGSSGSADHKWSSQDTFTVKTIAKDENGVISQWSDPLTVTIPKSKVVNKPLIRLLENYVHLMQIFKLLLQQIGL